MQLRQMKDEAYRLLAARKFKQAARAFHRLLVHDPKDPTFCVKYAEACRRIGKVDEATRGFVMAFELLLDGGHHAKAKAVVRMGLELSPNDPDLRRAANRLEAARRHAVSGSARSLDPERTGEHDQVLEVQDDDLLGPIDPPSNLWPTPRRDLSLFDFHRERLISAPDSAVHRVSRSAVRGAGAEALPVVMGVPFDPDDDVATDPFILPAE